jgi:hypothetical protein
MNLFELAELFPEFYLIDSPETISNFDSKENENTLQTNTPQVNITADILIVYNDLSHLETETEKMISFCAQLLKTTPRQFVVKPLSAFEKMPFQQIILTTGFSKIVSLDCDVYLTSNKIPLQKENPQIGKSARLLQLHALNHYSQRDEIILADDDLQKFTS